jgi:glycosyltransferase involved in cell wall biosynthesis
MIDGKKVVVVMPAYNAERTLVQTWREVVAQPIVDLIVVVDDASRDATLAVARGSIASSPTRTRATAGMAQSEDVLRPRARKRRGHRRDDHPDYQYTPKLIPAMAGLVASGLYPCVLGSRILGGQAIAGGMPWWRYCPIAC